MKALMVLVTDFGEFVIPDEVVKVTKFTKKGWPDKRSDASAFWCWYEMIKEQAA